MDEDNALFIDGVLAGMRGSAGLRPFGCARKYSSVRFGPKRMPTAYCGCP